MNVVSMMRVMLCASDMQTIPIFTGPFLNLKYRGDADAQKSPNFCIFIVHHHHCNLLIMKG